MIHRLSHEHITFVLFIPEQTDYVFCAPWASAARLNTCFIECLRDASRAESLIYIGIEDVADDRRFFRDDLQIILWRKSESE